MGGSGAGKTSVVEGVVAALAARGLRVGYLKHAHEGFEVDREGSDSWRARAAGADLVGVVAPDSSFVHETGNASVEQLLARAASCDVVLAEGWHEASWAKIVVRGHGADPRPAREPILAEVEVGADEGATDTTVDALVAAILAEPTHRPTAIELRVDGEAIELRGFAADVVVGTVTGLVSTLKGVDDPEVVELTIHRAW